MNTEIQAKEIYDYVKSYLANDLKVSKKHEKEMVQEIKFLIETS